MIGQLLIFGPLVISTFLWPYLGIVITVASLPVLDLLPPIPGFTSAISLIGAMTLAGFIIQRRGRDKTKPLFRFGPVHVIALLFLVWILISNPQAAWFGTRRNWVFTFAQLWILLWLGGELLDTPKKQQTLMWIFSIVVVISAYLAILQGHIGENVQNSIRGSGLADGVNAAARYFVIGMVFFNYLRSVSNKKIIQWITIAGMSLSTIGVFFSTSRTGILLVFIAFGLLILLNPYGKNKVRLLIILAIITLFVYFLSENLIQYLGSIVTNVVQRQDTVGYRIELWKVGWEMWSSHIFQGVGIGKYSEDFHLYAPYRVVAKLFAPDPHNTYVQVLAETGLVGFVIFILLIFKSLQNIWRSCRSDDKASIELRNVWLIGLIVMLLGGLTKTDTTEKLVWLIMGVSQNLYWNITGWKQKSTEARDQNVLRAGPVRNSILVQNEQDFSE